LIGARFRPAAIRLQGIEPVYGAEGVAKAAISCSWTSSCPCSTA